MIREKIWLRAIDPLIPPKYLSADVLTAVMPIGLSSDLQRYNEASPGQRTI